MFGRMSGETRVAPDNTRTRDSVVNVNLGAGQRAGGPSEQGEATVGLRLVWTQQFEVGRV